MGRQTRREDGLFDVEIALVLPRDGVTFLPGQDGRQLGRVHLWLAAKDTEDGTSPMRQIPVEFSLDEQQYEQAGKRGLPYFLSLEMKEGYTDLAFGIRDELGARASYIRHGVNVGRSF